MQDLEVMVLQSATSHAHFKTFFQARQNVVCRLRAQMIGDLFLHRRGGEQFGINGIQESEEELLAKVIEESKQPQYNQLERFRDRHFLGQCHVNQRCLLRVSQQCLYF